MAPRLPEVEVGAEHAGQRQVCLEVQKLPGSFPDAAPVDHTHRHRLHKKQLEFEKLQQTLNLC